MTGVDRLHELGVYGAGVSVAVIDTGIDYTHPALGGCLWVVLSSSFALHVQPSKTQLTLFLPLLLSAALAARSRRDTILLGTITTERTRRLDLRLGRLLDRLLSQHLPDANTFLRLPLASRFPTTIRWTVMGMAPTAQASSLLARIPTASWASLLKLLSVRIESSAARDLPPTMLW
jgi:hypothetical protein